MPKRGPKVEKKATGIAPSMLMKKMVRKASTKPREKTGTARTPMASEDTHMFAAHHIVPTL